MLLLLSGILSLLKVRQMQGVSEQLLVRLQK